MKTNGENQELQRLMNARLWRCIEASGGTQELSRSTGMSPQTFYNMRDNRTFPSTPTIKTIKRIVPRLNLDLLYSDSEHDRWEGEPPAEAPRPATPPKGADWDERLRAMEKKYEELQTRYDALFERYNRLVEMMMSKLAPSFKTAGSLSTVSLSGIGFRQRHQERDHTRTDRPAFRPLPGRLRRSQLV